MAEVSVLIFDGSVGDQRGIPVVLTQLYCGEGESYQLEETIGSVVTRFTSRVSLQTKHTLARP